MNPTARALLFWLSAPFVLTACSQQESAPAASQPAPEQVSAPARAAALHGTDMSKDNIGGGFTLTDGNGKLFQIKDLKGKAVILSFGYTHCPDVCPTELLTYNDTLKHLGGEAENVAVVFVSIDPERDTPELIGKYVKQFNPTFIGLTAIEGQDLPQIKRQYRIVSAKAQQQSEKIYLVDHSAGAYLLDKNGKVSVFSPYGSTAQQIADDIRILLKS